MDHLIMNRNYFKERIKISVAPCMFHVTGDDVVITTLLGSCVSACLYDPTTGIAGMNHFMLSNERYARDMPYCKTEAGRYGIHAMELLINEMLRRGARRGNITAKVFGGASIMTDPAMVGNFHCVGAVNCRFIEEFLETEGIRLVAADLGGHEGRVIYFDSRDYSVFVRKLRKQTSQAVAERDRKVWKDSLEKQKILEAGDAVAIWLSDVVTCNTTRLEK
jgi:chemotaxis protein CheD